MPNRIIKESVCTSEKIASLSDFEFRLWVGLITQADDAGRGDARPAIIKGHVFPLRDRVTAKDIDASLHALAAKGCVSLYETDGKPYFWFPSWAEHQRIRDCKPKYPEPPKNDASPHVAADCGSLRQTAADCGLNPIQSESNPNPNPKETRARRDTLHERRFGRYGWVKLTAEEHGKLEKDLGTEELARCIAYIDESAQSTGNKNRWKDWNLVLRKCSRDGWGLHGEQKKTAQNNDWMDEFM